VEELDWSVGEILNELRKTNLDRQTLVIFTSDNGPWLTCEEKGGSAGLLRGGKGSTWEGGLRVPCVAWWPGQIRAGATNSGLSSTLDIFPTIMALTHQEIKPNTDGHDLSPLLFETGISKRRTMFYYRKGELRAVRKGPWKAHFVTKDGYKKNYKEQDPPLLYNLETDPSEKINQADKHPDIIKDLIQETEKHKASVTTVPSQLDRIKKKE